MPSNPTAAAKITNIHLWDSDKNQSVQLLGPNTRLDFDITPPGHLSIRVEASAPVGSVRFGFDGDPAYHTELVDPYFISGNPGKVVVPWFGLTEGTHALTVTLFADAASTQPLDSRLVNLIVNDKSTALDPFPTQPPEPPVTPPLPAPTGQPQPPPAKPPAWGTPPKDDGGWTTIPAVLTGPDPIRQVRVAPDGSGDVKTIADGYKMLRPGAGDHLLLKRGATFVEPNLFWNKGGRPGRPCVLSAFGDPKLDRPRWLCMSNGPAVVGGGIRLGGGTKHVAFMHVHLHAARRDPAMAVNGPGVPAGMGFVPFPGIAEDRKSAPIGIDARADGIEDVLVEGMRISHFGNALVFTRKNLMDDAGGAANPNRKLVIRRNVIDHSWHDAQFQGQGVYTGDWADVLLEENIFYHNGWHPGILPGMAATAYRHNAYLGEHANSGYVIRRNVFAFGGSFGCQYRGADGVYDDNFFFDNAIACSVGGRTGTLTNNVVFAGHAHTAGGLSVGCGWGGLLLQAGKSTATNNRIIRMDFLAVKFPIAAITVNNGKFTAGKAQPTLQNNVTWGYDPANPVMTPYDFFGKRGPLPPGNPPPAKAPPQGMLNACLPTAPWAEIRAAETWAALLEPRAGNWKPELMAKALNDQVRANVH